LRVLRSHGGVVATHSLGENTGVAGINDPAPVIMPRQRGSLSDPVTAPAAPVVAPVAAPVVDAVSAAADAVGSLTRGQSFSAWLRYWGLHLEVGAAFLVGVTVAFVEDPHPNMALLALSVWLLGAYHSGRAVTTPLTRQFRSLLVSISAPLSVVAAAVAFLELSPLYISRTVTTLGAASIVAVLFRSLRWRWQAPVRVVVVGDRAAVATATTRWTHDPSVQLVGGLVAEPDLEPGAVPHEILGVPTAAGIDTAGTLAERWEADLVVVHPGPGVDAEVFRRLTWALEGTRTAIGVSGLLESVSPHRITPGRLNNLGVIDVRHPRPSTVVRGIKSALDRSVGLVLLVLVLPLLALLGAAIRLDSKGPVLFKQTRIGREGKPFTLYKLRTMVPDADEIKDELRHANEADDVLFKIKDDPRVTRLGSFLRKASLDELPQLVNVVRGEMALVGPRPFIPSEVAQMDQDTLRRHAVQPGITGLWQVSGRSDLSWDAAAELDTYYADNWSLAMDAKIAAQTVRAVVAAKGAY
jgi:exopolysaccharide biosynthesis polyprenyl glycosylphosphotransferase